MFIGKMGSTVHLIECQPLYRYSQMDSIHLPALIIGNHRLKSRQVFEATTVNGRGKNETETWNHLHAERHLTSLRHLTRPISGSEALLQLPSAIDPSEKVPDAFVPYVVTRSQTSVHFPLEETRVVSVLQRVELVYLWLSIDRT